MKFNRLAVLICGDFRYWPRASQYIFEYFESFSDHVDYYFATWNETRDHWWPEPISIQTRRPVSPADICDKFIGRNLIDYQLFDQSILPRYDITFYYQAYLALQANSAKCRYESENNFVYDQVFEVRPDIYIRKIPVAAAELFPCVGKQYSIGPTWFDKEDGVDYEKIGDFMSRSSSQGNDIISQRFYFKNTTQNLTKTNNHRLFLEFLRSMGLESVSTNACNSMPIRSNFPTDCLSNYSMEYLGQLSKEWYDQVYRYE